MHGRDRFWPLRRLSVSSAGVLLTAAFALGLPAGEPQEVWSYELPDWVPSQASIGEEGTQVFLAKGGYLDHLRLLSAFDDATPQPVWSSAPNSGSSSRHYLASAAAGDVHAQLRTWYPTGSNTGLARYEQYRSASATPVNTFQFPFPLQDTTQSGVAMSADGQVIACWVQPNVAAGTTFAIFTPGQDAPTVYETVLLYGHLRGVALSEDGSTIYVSGFTYTRIFEVATWTLLHQTLSNPLVERGGAISADGRAYAQSELNGVLSVYRRLAGGYERVLAHPLPGYSTSYKTFIDLSRDGSLVACGYSAGSGFNDVRVQVLDLEAPGSPVVFDESLHGSGALDNVFGDLDLSPDGSRLALALWGDEAGLVDELRVYEQSRGAWSNVLSEPLRGSGLVTRFSPGGDTLLVTNKSAHANTFASGGDVTLYRFPDRDLTLHGVPSIGNTVTLEHRLAPGALSRSVRAGAPQDPPIPFPNTGTLYIDRSDLLIFAAETADGTGVARTSYSIPNDPNRIGTTVWFQSFQAAPRRLSQDYVKMTILP